MVTTEERNAAKRLILGIIQQAGGTLYGQTRLYKIFYHSHLFYWKSQAGVLSTYPIVHMPKGPGIDHGELLIEDLARVGAIQATTRPRGPYTEDVYSLVTPPEPALTAAEAQSIQEAIDFIGGQDAKKISQDTHETSRSWNAAHSGRELNIYLDVLSDLEYAQMLQRQRKAAELLDSPSA